MASFIECNDLDRRNHYFDVAFESAMYTLERFDVSTGHDFKFLNPFESDIPVSSTYSKGCEEPEVNFIEVFFII